MNYTYEDLEAALKARPSHPDVVGLRLGSPWKDLLGSRRTVCGLPVTVVLNWHSEQPVLVTMYEPGCVIEDQLVVYSALKRTALELIRQGWPEVEAPYHCLAGSREVTKLTLKAPGEAPKLTALLRAAGGSLEIAEEVRLVLSSDMHLLVGHGLTGGQYVVDWAVEHLGAAVDTRRLIRELEKFREIQNRYGDKYLGKAKEKREA